jgi:hypothetical protein
LAGSTRDGTIPVVLNDSEDFDIDRANRKLNIDSLGFVQLRTPIVDWDRHWHRLDRERYA